MSNFQIITGVIVGGLLVLCIAFLYREIKSKRKIPYQKLFEKPKKTYLTHNNRFIGFMVAIFFLSIFSFIFLFRITLISVSIALAVLIVLVLANVFLLRKKYKIKEKQDIAWITVVITIGQLSLFLWLNFIPVGSHFEEYKIQTVEEDAGTGVTIIHLENDVYDEYYSVRSFDSNNIPEGDTIIYSFNEGLLGFKIYTGHVSH